MARGQLSLWDLYNKVDYFHTNMTKDKIILKEMGESKIGFYVQDIHKTETLVGVMSEDEKIIVMDNGQFNIGGFFFTGFCVVRVDIAKAQLEEIPDDSI